MFETYGADDVSLNVRISNTAALALYKDTLGFYNSGTDAKYYGDGENAYCMKKKLDYLRRETVVDDWDDEDEALTVGQDEGDAVGSEGKASSKTNGSGEAKEKLINVKMGRGLGVNDLVERNEAIKS